MEPALGAQNKSCFLPSVFPITIFFPGVTCQGQEIREWFFESAIPTREQQELKNKSVERLAFRPASQDQLILKPPRKKKAPKAKGSFSRDMNTHFSREACPNHIFRFQLGAVFGGFHALTTIVFLNWLRGCQLINECMGSMGWACLLEGTLALNGNAKEHHKFSAAPFLTHTPT